jgi:hypothetical protein
MPANEMTVEALLRTHAPHAPESLRERVFALEPGPRRAWLPRRRLALVALPAAVGVAVSVAVIHGIVGSSASKPSAAVRHTLDRPPVASGANTNAGGAGATWTTASQGRALGATGTFKTLHAPAAVPAVGASARLQHTAASLRISVPSTDELAQATTRATRIATSLGGYAKSIDYRSQGTSVIDLRIPTQNVKTALARLAGLGTIVTQRLSVTDLQQQFKTQSDEIAQLRRRIAALRTAITDPSLPDAQKVLLRIQLAESRRALSQRLHARTGTVSAGTTSSVSVVIGTKKAIATVPHREGRIGRMLDSAVGFLALEAIVALYALIVVSPFALIGAAVWLWRRRSVDRLLAA